MRAIHALPFNLVNKKKKKMIKFGVFRNHEEAKLPERATDFAGDGGCVDGRISQRDLHPNDPCDLVFDAGRNCGGQVS